ncbi:DUF3581 domain-containing protein [Dasania sp. GY-MA-18]|uniref:DUF3581 domain-containing protein n=1 Tax=Dasania phycosphaerae TaxID=2950436 RepID=A0A9J6RH41_9GAMM|nr:MULTISPECIES: DUF3581 domain-containing protein [Dasania]MCR8921172.1 DUF3581 domain-containing protein [Dasania sp. GY-MA-18]MCZ0863600.1 DUF3581 domain-containing protein [Dasania phycosphaerae]MCZ0867328.1 DUF3581 domain-containing protein [Dasania phycosphaerae]
MLIDQYYSQDQQKISFSRQQASDFAKNIADDFNPLHDADAKRFCVPGDLLFAIVLSKYGISQHMQFTFSGMVSDGVALQLPAASTQLSLKDGADKEYLSIEQSGDNCRDQQLIDTLTQRYVAFSGQTFPHILMPLLKEQAVMINPDRPMVIYESMLIELNRLDRSDIELALNKEQTHLESNGKRGKICLAFTLLAGGEEIGRGEKRMLLSGLKPYDQQAVDQLVNNYNEGKARHKS